MPAGALDGLRVLELSRGVASSYCGKLLADFGADVLKVERPDGDPVRRLGPFPKDRPHLERGGMFQFLNTNKRGITLDLRPRSGRAVFESLAAASDVIISGLKPDTLERLGLGYESLAAQHPDLVLTSITPFGLDGPYRDWQSTELIAQAVSGIAHLTGDAARPPLRFAQAQSQFVTGVNGAVSTLIAREAVMSGEAGQLVDVSTLQSIAAFYFNIPSYYTFMGINTWRGVNDLYPCQDGYLVAIAGAGRTWSDFAAFLQAPELDGPDFNTPSARSRNQGALRAHMTARLAARSPREWFHAAQERHFPWGMFQRISQLADCPQLEARQFFTTVDVPGFGVIPIPGAPAKLSETPSRARRPAPGLGEHNRDVYGALGFSALNQVRLRQAGII